MIAELHKETHLDHGLTKAHLDWVLAQDYPDGVSTRTWVLPPHLPVLSSAVYGPEAGDPPVPESEVTYRPRGDRPYPSRLVRRPVRPTRQVTVITGPHDGRPCVLYTAHGGPATPYEPDDPNCPSAGRDRSVAFWAEHALADPDPDAEGS